MQALMPTPAYSPYRVMLPTTNRVRKVVKKYFVRVNPMDISRLGRLRGLGQDGQMKKRKATQTFAYRKGGPR